jgi:hypothetical protein
MSSTAVGAARPPPLLGASAPLTFMLQHSPNNNSLLLQLLNKVDLLSPEQRAELEGWFEANCGAERTLPISALNATNTPSVVDWVVSKLPEGPSMYPKVPPGHPPGAAKLGRQIRGGPGAAPWGCKTRQADPRGGAMGRGPLPFENAASSVLAAPLLRSQGARFPGRLGGLGSALLLASRAALGVHVVSTEF